MKNHQVINIKKKRKGVELADMGLVVAFIGVVAITMLKVTGDELKDFFYYFNVMMQMEVRQKGLEASEST